MPYKDLEKAKAYRDAYNKKYREVNKEKLSAKRALRKDKQAEYDREYYKQNKDAKYSYTARKNYMDKYREKNRTAINTQQRTRYQDHIEEEHERSKKRNHDPEYRESRRVYGKVYRDKNHDKLVAKSQRYYAENKEKHAQRRKDNPEKTNEIQRRSSSKYRARKLLQTVEHITKDQLDERFRLFGNRCAYCGSDNNGATLAADHVIPVSRGGLHCLRNLIPVCTSCNSRKHNKNWIRWYRNQSFYKPEQEVAIKAVLQEIDITEEEVV